MLKCSILDQISALKSEMQQIPSQVEQLINFRLSSFCFCLLAVFVAQLQLQQRLKLCKTKHKTFLESKLKSRLLFCSFRHKSIIELPPQWHTTRLVCCWVIQLAFCAVSSFISLCAAAAHWLASDLRFDLLHFLPALLKRLSLQTWNLQQVQLLLRFISCNALFLLLAASKSKWNEINF